MGISALVFSINEYKYVKRLVTLLSPYVNEIVIIDSSTKKDQLKKMRIIGRNKKVKLIWLPPLGIVEFYYQIGIKECKNEWILMLDSDHFPSKKFLRKLNELVSVGYNGYKVGHFFRLFKKRFAKPSGIIHWVMFLKNTKTLRLDENYIKVVRRDNLEKMKQKYLVKYSKIEAFQAPLKILTVESIKREKILTPLNKNIVDLIYMPLSKISKISIYLSLFLYLLLLEIYVALKNKPKSLWLFYPISTFFYFIKSPYKNLLIAKIMKKEGTYNFLDLNSKTKLIKNSKILEFGSDGIENLFKLIEYKLKQYLI
ncbi:MAG: glycosyltransferase [Candidatus Aenigmatarchaeota archaeon]|jgi:hypothetical protein